MTSVKDLEESIFLTFLFVVVSFMFECMRLINHALEQEGSMCLINNRRLITRVYGIAAQAYKY